jgi:hypothetical protein
MAYSVVPGRVADANPESRDLVLTHHPGMRVNYSARPVPSFSRHAT